MDHDQPTGLDSLSEQLEDLASTRRHRFLGELHSGRNPRIEDFTGDVSGVVRPAILRVLLEAEFEWRRGRGEEIDSREWRERFPEHRDLVDELLGDDQPTLSMGSPPPLPGDFELRLPPNVQVGQKTESGRYKVVRRHARGGLGIVNLAIDRELRRDVALKEIRPDSADNVQYRARFLREAEVTARLEHPGIVPVYGIGQHDDGRPYYIMRFIRGETLKSAILRLHNLKPEITTARDPGDAKPIKYTLHALAGRLIDACHTLAYAHDRKILHRDIKPDNIMLGPFGETLVVDWGLAKLLDELERDERDESEPLQTESDNSVLPTEYGSKLGTVGFMSPEQAAGSLAELRPTSDVYSLGVTLYQMMTGRTPFEGAGQEEFLARVREGKFRRPSEVKSSVPRALEAICLKAMALKPADRYPSAEALADDIERWRSGERVEADYLEPRIDRVARWSKKHRTILATAAALLVSSTIGLGVIAVQESRKIARISEEVTITRAAEAAARNSKAIAEDATAAAREDQATAQANLALTRQTLRDLMDRLSVPELAFLANAAGPRLAMAQNVLGFYRDLLVKHPDDPEIKNELALASRTTANIARSIGAFDDAQKIYDQSRAIFDSLMIESPGSDEYRIDLARTMIDLAANLDMSGHPRDAEAWQLRAIQILDGRAGAVANFDERYRRTRALGLLDLACSRLEMSRAREALSDIAKSLEILKFLSDKQAADVFDQIYYIHAIVNRSLIQAALGDLDQARNDLAEASKSTQKLLESPSNDTPNVRFIEAVISSRQGRLFAMAERHSESLPAFENAFQQLRAIITKGFEPVFIHRELAVAWLGRAEARLELLGSEPDSAQVETIQKDLNRAIERLEMLIANWGQHHDYRGLMGQAHAACGRLARLQKEMDRATRHLEKACEEIGLACNLNPDERGYRESRSRYSEELKRVQADRSDPTPGR